MSAVHLQNLQYRYSGSQEPAVRGIDFQVRDGELVSLLGPSGCGKTTTLKLIAGLLRPTGGAVYFNNREVTDVKPERREAVMVFQNYLLFPYMTIEENVGFGLRMRRLDRRDIKSRVGENNIRNWWYGLADPYNYISEIIGISILVGLILKCQIYKKENFYRFLHTGFFNNHKNHNLDSE